MTSYSAADPDSRHLLRARWFTSFAERRNLTVAASAENRVFLRDLAESRAEVPALIRDVNEKALPADGCRYDLGCLQPPQMIVLGFVPIGSDMRDLVNQRRQA